MVRTKCPCCGHIEDDTALTAKIDAFEYWLRDDESSDAISDYDY